MPMTSVVTGNVVVVGQVRTNTNSDGFLPSIKMHKTRNFTGSKLLTSTILKLTDCHHLLVHLEQARLIQCLRTATNIFCYHSCNLLLADKSPGRSFASLRMTLPK